MESAILGISQIGLCELETGYEPMTQGMVRHRPLPRESGFKRETSLASSVGCSSLWRPSPAISSESCHTANSGVIRDVRQRQGSRSRASKLFLAGFTLMHCVLYSRGIQRQISLSNLAKTTQSCSSVLAIYRPSPHPILFL